MFLVSTKMDRSLNTILCDLPPTNASKILEVNFNTEENIHTF